MAYRKKDLSQVHEFQYPDAFEFYDEITQEDREVYGTSIKINTHVVKKSSKDISKEQLDPRIVTLEQMIEAGVTIDPSVVHHMLDTTDPAELAEKSSQMSENLYQHLVSENLINVDEK